MKTEFSTRDLKHALRNGPYAWPGGYPLYFITADGGALSFESVRGNFREILLAMRRNDGASGWKVVAVETNWEDPELYCDHSGGRIESAYAEPVAAMQENLEQEQQASPATPLPPDPEGRNDERAAWAKTALEAFMAETRTDDGDAIADLLADLMHLCDRQPARFGGFEAELERARMHYAEETTEA